MRPQSNAGSAAQSQRGVARERVSGSLRQVLSLPPMRACGSGRARALTVIDRSLSRLE